MINCQIEMEMKSATAIQQWNNKYYLLPLQIRAQARRRWRNRLQLWRAWLQSNSSPICKISFKNKTRIARM